MKRFLTTLLIYLAICVFVASRCFGQTSVVYGLFTIVGTGNSGGGSVSTNNAVFVRQSVGSESNPGTTNQPWQYIPGDNRSGHTLNAGSICYVYGGEQYVLSTNGIALEQATPNIGIQLVNGISVTQPTIYDGSMWGNGSKAVITDNGSNGGSNSLAAFENYSALQNITIRGFQIGPLGGGAIDITSYPAGAYNYPVTGPQPGGGSCVNTGLPASFAWGIYTGGNVSNLVVSGNLFTGIGLWQNQYPIGQCSLAGIGIHTVAGNAPSLSNFQIVSNEFTKVCHGVDLGLAAATNVVVSGNNFHDYILWGTVLAFANATAADGIAISSNSLHDMGWAYYQAYGTYYGVTNTGYHQDPIFLNVASPCVFGSNINIYANTFSDSHTTNSSAATGQIFLSGGASANIYANLLNIQTGASGGGNFITVNDGVQNGSTLSCNLLNPVQVVISNNTFIADHNNGILQCGAGDPYNGITAYWPTNHTIQVLNNIGYEFDTNGSDSGSTHLFIFGTIGNTNTFSSWTIDYNDWSVTNLTDWFDVTDTNGAHSDTLALMKQYGFEAHGTNCNPQFIDISHGSMQNAYLNNYSLSNSSPCLTAGQGGGKQGAF